MPIQWAILTGEYPPDTGGVSDYSRLVARGLVEAGDRVNVYAPPSRGEDVADPGVRVHRLPGNFGPRSLAQLEQLLARRPRPDRILLQYVPHAFGYKAMNLPLATWIGGRAGRIAPVWVMFHEVAAPFIGRSAKHMLLGTATRVMARLIAGAAERIFVSIPAWGSLLKRICPRARPAVWLPVPCNVSTDADPVAVETIRSRFAPDDGALVGHFGTYGGLIADLLAPAAGELLRLAPQASLLLIGRGSDAFRARLIAARPEIAPRVHATSEVALEHVASYIRACDLMLQPFPDGISARRTSAMAGLANGVPTVTNLGALSEQVWADGGIAVVATPDPAALAARGAKILADTACRIEFGRRGAALYRETFAVEHTIARLRETS